MSRQALQPDHVTLTEQELILSKPRQALHSLPPCGGQNQHVSASGWCAKSSRATLFINKIFVKHSLAALA
jgi:hypothetical protein